MSDTDTDTDTDQQDDRTWRDRNKALFTSAKTDTGTDQWATPPWIYRPIAEAVDGFDLDPASGAEDSPIADHAYTVDDDGLHSEWFGDVFVNPPYSTMSDWTAKARDEHTAGRTDRIFFLMPNRSDTQYYHDGFVQSIRAKVEFKGRVEFVGDGGGDGAPFPVTLMILSQTPLSPPVVDAVQPFGQLFVPLSTDSTQTTLPDHVP